MLRGIEREELTAPTQLIASELVTGAIKASGLRTPTYEEIEQFGMYAGVEDFTTIWLGIYPISDGIVLEVWDLSRNPPILAALDIGDHCGQGVFLVDLISECWGYHRPKTGGKVVWAKLNREAAGQ
ncbi:ATP-binding protein [Spongiactinospora rosea]|uniref:ATP-binding protein n=1 Tax=Spongiactinospora rosea TaxID=2248750 RepID=UPI0011C083EA|nr:ATP-binding protein [Spongiactinospora rosea]